VARFASNKAALALELGVTWGTVSLWMAGRSIPDEGSCLHVAKITGHAAAAVFRLAGRDNNLPPVAPELIARRRELAARVRQWARCLRGLLLADRAIALSVLDVVVDEAPSASWRRRTPPAVAEGPNAIAVEMLLHLVLYHANPFLSIGRPRRTGPSL
jgi:hypothetical protein